MKKYTLFLFIFAFIFSFFNVSFAQVSVSGCQSGDLYNRMTGEACVSEIKIICEAGEIYSHLTGQRCTTTETPSVSVPTISYPKCNIVNYDIGSGSKMEKVREFQQSLKDEGFYTGKVDGVYGSKTEIAKTNYLKKCPVVYRNSGVVISGVSGPQSLKVGETGTWTVNAYDKNGGDLSYSVNWGDEQVYASYGSRVSTKTSVTQQSATFTHSYSTVGTYNPTFTVTSPYKVSPCLIAPCPTSGGSASTSLSVKVGKADKSTITVISPNGGEKWKTGTTQTIKWKNNATPTCTGTRDWSCVQGYPSRYYDIMLIQHADCDGCGPASFSIANRVSESSYSWVVGDNINPSEGMSGNIVFAGPYTIKVCQTGTSVCDYSDNYFTITSGTTSQPSIQLFGSSGDTKSDSSLTVALGGDITISGVPKNLQGLSYWTGTGFPTSGYYNRAFFLDQNFSNNNGCKNNEASVDRAWTITCTAKVPGTSVFYVEIYANGQTYRSNKITVNVSSSTTPLSITTSSPLPNAKVGTSYKAYIYASSGSNFYYWSEPSGSTLPSGLWLTSSNDCGISNSSSPNVSNCILIVGTPNIAGTFNFNLQVSLTSPSSASTTANKQFSLTVDSEITAQPPVIFAVYPEGCSSGNSAYSSTTGQSCGQAVIGSTVSVAGSNFRNGDTVKTYSSTTGDLVALPTTFVSSTQLTFQVLSSAGPGVHGLIVNTVTGIKSNTVSLTFVDGTTTEITFTTPSILPNAKVGQPYFVALNASSCGYTPGDDNCRWTASESSFPIGGLGLSSSYGNPVYIMGTPSKIYVNGVESQVPYTATFSFTVTSEYRSGFKQFTLTVDPATISQSSTGGVLGSEKFYFTQALREGAQGDQVMELQKLLNAKSGLGLVVDGKFGATTKSALMKFQVSNNLIVDGVVGPAVRAVLNK